MKPRRLRPSCFYCDDATHGAVSRIDEVTPVCTGCAYAETTDPQASFDRWIALGGDRAAAMAFADSLNARGRVFPVRYLDQVAHQIGGVR